MKLSTSDANCKNLTKREKITWEYPPDRPWFEFVFITILTLVCTLSIVSLMISANSAKAARTVATARLEVIYEDLKNSEHELLQMKINHVNDEKIFHGNLNRSMKVQTILLKRIAEQLGVPASEVGTILKKDPNY